jgi:membrane protein DedA with SNARE-associated domain
VAAPEEDLSGIAGWVVDVVDKVGELGVGALITLENVFPPIPSEVILPFAGFSAERGEINGLLAWVAATIGALVGALILYGVGALVSYERIHELAGKRWFILFGQSDLERGERFFDRHGNQIVLFGRFIPLVRSIVSVPAGLDRMPLVRFSVLTLIGSGIWNAIFIWAGYVLGSNYDRVEGWIGPIGYAVLALLLAGLVWLVVRRIRRGRP